MERIIRHLKIMRIWAAEGQLDAADCGKVMKWLDEALDKLTPRLLTVDDFKDNPDMDAQGFLPCWLEYNKKGRTELVELGIFDSEDEVADEWGVANADDVAKADHGRYWTGRPDRQLMRATPWDT